MSRVNPKPAIFDIINGNPNNRTKKQLEEKVERQFHIGSLNFTPSENLLKDEAAKKLWDEQVKMILASGADFITTFDSKTLEDWCFSCAEKDRLEKTKQQIFKEAKEKNFSMEKIFYHIEELGLQDAINKLIDLSLRLRRALGLDPLSRLNALKKKNEPKIDKTDKYEKEFGNI